MKQGAKAANVTRILVSTVTYRPNDDTVSWKRRPRCHGFSQPMLAVSYIIIIIIIIIIS